MHPMRMRHIARRDHLTDHSPISQFPFSWEDGETEYSLLVATVREVSAAEFPLLP